MTLIASLPELAPPVPHAPQAPSAAHARQPFAWTDLRALPLAEPAIEWLAAHGGTLETDPADRELVLRFPAT